MKYQVIVVGGRIGGSVSSLFASKSDVDVLMIEKQQEIGVPVQCAEGTTAGTLQTLQMKPSRKYIANKVDGTELHAPNGEIAKILGGMAEGYVLERKIFDKHLAQESARAGTDIMLKTTVKDLIIKEGKVCGVVAKHLGKTMEIGADVVIAADGIQSNIARIAGLNTLKKQDEICSCAQYEMVGVDGDPNWIKLYFGTDMAPGGYAWIFPKGDGVANVGIGIRSSERTAYEYLEKFTAKMDATPTELNIGGVPLSGPVEKTFTDGLMVVGDAAGQVEPLTGGGIHTTAVCSRIAGEVAAEAVKEEDTSSGFLKKYEDLWKSKIGKDLEMSLKYRKMADKLRDEDMDALAEFLKNNDPNSLSKISALKFLSKHPNLLKHLKELL
jgi:digeranylgeranylglycerophospholipid reductase